MRKPPRSQLGLALVTTEDESELSTLPSPEDSDIELNMTPAIPDSEDEMVLDSPEPSPNLATESGLRDLEPELLKQKGYVFTLTNRLSEMQREVDELKHCDRAANSEQFDLRDQMSKLKSKLEAKERLTRDFEALKTDGLAFPKTSAKKEFELLYHNISDTSSLICDMSADDNLPEERSGFPQSVQTWAMQISGGWNALHRLDLVAIKSLMEGEDVKNEVISERAKWLSLLITRTLSCFLPSKSRDMNQRLSLNDAEKEMMNDLENTLSRALSIKMDLTLSVKRYKFVFFKPGTEFDADNMQGDGMKTDGTIPESQGIKLCLLPALFFLSVEKDDGGYQDVPSSFSMNYHESLTETNPDGLQSLVIVSKAVVLV
ncbi:hypothetical protein FSARC_645 [Fusarium sarcochroum]|uniref:Uncharacterized protein n=1 Tax=Fusarium sarcochroum TaxID=1208366 RepID=A0A8H4XG54_9HYPO|nr:hypothetical protein FSARC_645 [Fusarium sarcochroum]